MANECAADGRGNESIVDALTRQRQRIKDDIEVSVNTDALTPDSGWSPLPRVDAI
ncbi:hypothetical protein [Microvirga sp. VF16]|uniref:hypothetical protein n=1 Tax=Microvirga sp. VF16 TaxID=2807101 RepID=UPI00193EC153|nr:hypothetical protein [Microvirga sp. VF16]QRM32309.1 hypothetical protein JO965_29745 [Microvirga sp. VF16]